MPRILTVRVGRTRRVDDLHFKFLLSPIHNLRNVKKQATGSGQF